MGTKQMFKRLRQVLGYLLLLALPFNFQPLIAGVLFGKFHNDQVSKGTRLYLQEIESFHEIDQWSVPGAPSIWDYQDNQYPFFIPKLQANTWHNKLGVSLPYSDDEDYAWENIPIDRLVTFDGAVRDVTCHVGKPTEWWVYISELGMPEVFEWDEAFLHLLEYHEMHSLPSNTSFAYIDCVASPFLCHVWRMQYPALVHFKIDEGAEIGDDIDTSAFKSPPKDLRPLEVRVFDLGLQQEVSPLPASVFPSRLAQMKALTATNGAYTIGEVYYEPSREYDQFNKHYYFPACDRPGSFLDITSDIDNWLQENIAKKLGLGEVADELAGVALTIGLNLVNVFYLVANPVADYWTHFRGELTEIEKLAAEVEERAGQQRDDGFDDLFGPAMRRMAEEKGQLDTDWLKGWIRGHEAQSTA